MYAWLFADYTWKHTCTYTPAVAAFIAEQLGIPQCQVPPMTSAGAVLSAGAATAAVCHTHGRCRGSPFYSHKNIIVCIVFIVYIAFIVYTTYLAYSPDTPYLTVSRAY